MSKSTWYSIIHGLYAATYKSYMRKSARQRQKKEVQAVWADMDGFCANKKDELLSGTYHVGEYRHFSLRDKKKIRSISVLPYADRSVQNAVKDAIEPIVLKQMTDDMMGGLPKCGVVATDRRHSVVCQVRKAMNNRKWKYVLQGDISKFYDNVDNVITIRLLEGIIKDKRTLSLIRQHLFNQKKLAIGDPFSHLLANLNMSVIIRKAKEKYGSSVEIINFADDFLAFSAEKELLEALRGDLRKWAKEMRLRYKPMYIREVDKERHIRFCGYVFGIGYVRITNATKKRYIKARHKSRSMGSYNGLLNVADIKNLRYLIELKDNTHMAEKIRRPFAGRPMKVEALDGIKHTITDFEEKISKQKDCDRYVHVQAIAEGLGLIVYSTGSSKICAYFKSKTRNDLPLRDMKIIHDWSGYYYDGTVYTDSEEEEMIRKQFNI